MLSLRRRLPWILAATAMVMGLTSCGEAPPTPDWTTFSPECTEQALIDAIHSANGDGHPSEIQLPADCPYTLHSVDNTQILNGETLRNGLPVINSEITIRGNNAVIDIQPAPGEMPFGHFFVAPEHDLNLYDLTLSNGVRPMGGAVVNHSGDFFAYNVQFLDNFAYPGGDGVAKGGAIYSFFGRVRILAGSVFQGNFAGETMGSGANLGGAVYAINANLLINESSFVENYAAGNGGAVYNRRTPADLEGGLVTIQSAEFLQNQALQDGGAIYLMEEGDGAIIVTSTFTQNDANRYGGAIYSQDSDLTADQTEFTSNQAASGGAVYTRRSAEGALSSLISDHSTYSSNTAAEMGGGVFSENSDVEMEDTELSGNQAGSCGAIQLGGYTGLDIAAGDLESSLWMNSDSELHNCTIMNNEATSGMGGGICHLMGELSVQGSTVNANNTPSYGGGLVSTSALEVSSSSFSNNMAYHGGGLALGFPRDRTLSFTPDLSYFAFTSYILGSAISDNQSGANGGGLWAHHGGAVIMDKSVIGGNTSAYEGGGIYQDEGDLVIRNTTIAGNTGWRGGGLYAEGTGSTDPVLNLTHVTVAYNTATDAGSELRSGGGGLNMNGRVYIDGTLVALNTSNDCDLNQGMRDKGDYVECNQTYCVSHLLNIDSDDSCGFDIPPEPAPQLDSFNGTFVPLLSGSPLIDIFSIPICSAPDDQLGNTRPYGSNCEPGSIEYGSTLPAPQQPPPPLPRDPGSSDEGENCDPFAGLDISVFMLQIDPETLSFPVYLGFPQAVPALPDDGSMPFRGELGEFMSYLVSQQGFEGRLYFLFNPSRSAIGSTRDLRVFMDGCEEPVFSYPSLTIPEFPSETEELVCRRGLGPSACADAGGLWFTGVDDPFCICP
jgi:predicted outer membrane repeat protein